MDRKEQAERTMYRFLAFMLLASIISTMYLGWAAIVAWVLSAATLMTLFYIATGDKPGSDGGNHRPCRRQ